MKLLRFYTAEDHRFHDYSKREVQGSGICFVGKMWVSNAAAGLSLKAFVLKEVGVQGG